MENEKELEMEKNLILYAYVFAPPLTENFVFLIFFVTQLIFTYK